MTKCYRCKNIVPEPDVKEAVAREMDWREWEDTHPDEVLREPNKRVLICIPCADELETDVEAQ
jgi:hypothetical protein